MIEFELSFAGDQTIVADPALLKQALANVIDNGIHAYPDGRGKLRVSASAKGGEMILDITDFGVGIPERNLDKIFTPFFSSRPAGTGLGLPLASKIVHMHGGRITVTSAAGKGTSFRIHLPMKAEALAPQAHPATT